MPEADVAVAPGAAPAPSTAPSGPTPSAGDSQAQPATGGTATPEEQPGTDGEQKAPSAKPEPKYTEDDLRRARAKEHAIAQRRADRELAYRVENEVLRRQLAGTIPPGAGDRASGAPGQEPRPEDFQDWDSYNRALVRHEAEQAIRQQLERGSRAQRDAVAHQREEQFAQTVQQRMAESGMENYEDFMDVVGATGVTFTEPMVHAILKTHKPAEVAYNLALNRAENARIAALDVAGQVLEVKKFADALGSTPAPTTAPAPIKPGKAEGSVTPTLETAKNYAEWLKIRNRQLGRTT